jgi:hypothetical protein
MAWERYIPPPMKQGRVRRRAALARSVAWSKMRVG